MLCCVPSLALLPQLHNLLQCGLLLPPNHGAKHHQLPHLSEDLVQRGAQPQLQHVQCRGPGLEAQQQQQQQHQGQVKRSKLQVKLGNSVIYHIL